jgi:hypothetical protein
VHGGVYDPYSGNLIVFGSDEINEITTGGLLLAHEVATTPQCNTSCFSSSEFDQGALDGFGHLFIAWNGGGVFFEDYSATGIIGSQASTGNFHYFTTDGGAFNYMDDLAPIIGPGATA